jgi:glycosyltransferase involved in cell wall biosynthesis
MEIKFSIHIPVYNAEKYIRMCLNSVLEQSYDNYEVILTDDGSTDNSGTICDEYAKKDTRIRVCHRENKGLLYTRRESFTKTTGEYCVILDSDDSLKPGALETIYTAIKTYECDMVIYNYDRVNGNEYTPNPTILQDGQIFEGKTKSILYEILISDSRLNALWIKAVRSDIIDQSFNYTSYFGLKAGEDILQSLPLIKKAEKIVYIDKRIYNYTLNPSGITNTFSPYKYIDYDRIQEAIWHFMREVDMDDAEHIVLFANSYMYLYMGCIHSIICSDLPHNKKIQLLDTIKTLKLYSEVGKKYFQNSSLHILNRCTYQLYNKKNYNVLFCFANVRKYLSRIKQELLNFVKL